MSLNNFDENIPKNSVPVAEYDEIIDSDISEILYAENNKLVSSIHDIANKALDTIAVSLPNSISSKILRSNAEFVFVHVFTDESTADKHISFLQKNGFRNF